MKILLFIRAEQFRALLRNRGKSKKILALMFILLFLISMCSIISGKSGIYLTIPGILLLILHSVRNDYYLLKKTGLSAYTIMLIEYLLLTLPNLVAGILNMHFTGVILLSAFIIILPLISGRQLILFR